MEWKFLPRCQFEPEVITCGGTALVSPYLRTHCSSQQLRGLKSLEMSLTLPFSFVLWPSLRDSRRELGQGFATLFCFVLKRNYMFVVTNVVVKHNMFFILKMDGGRELERDWCLVRFAYFRKMVYICMLSLLKGCIHTELLPGLRGGGGVHGMRASHG